MPATNHDLLERYLHAVKFWLPKAQQDDILAELAEDLQSQIEERESALGHPLSDEELAGILKRRGAPMRIASGYLPEQRLIPAAMLPVYRLALKIALLWVLLPLFVIVYAGPLFTAAHPVGVLVQFWIDACRTGFMVVGIVTAVFVVLDRCGVSPAFEKWDPRKLPRVPAAHDTAMRWNHLAGFLFGILAASFWAGFMWRRAGFDLPGDVHVTLGAVWKYVYWPLLVLTTSSASADLLAFLRPCWATVRSRVRLGVDASMLAGLAAVFIAGNWVQISAPHLSAGDLANVAKWVNAGIEISVWAAAVITAGDAIVEIRRILRASRRAVAERQAVII
jgi:hypothetical protein